MSQERARVEVETIDCPVGPNGSRGSLHDQYLRLTEVAGSSITPHGSAASWLFVRDVASATGVGHKRLAIATEWLLEERKDAPDDSPERANGAAERLAEALKDKAKEVAELWEGKGHLQLVSNYKINDDNTRGAAVARMIFFSFEGDEGDESPPDTLRGLWTTSAEENLDRAFTKWIRALGTAGEATGKALDEKLNERNASREDVKATLASLSDPDTDPPKGTIELAFYDLWASSEGGNLPRWAMALASALWFDVVRPQLEREGGASGGFRISYVSGIGTGDRYTKLPKLVAPLSWAFGGTGAEAFQEIKIDGNRYAKAPSLAADVAAPNTKEKKPIKLVPKSFTLLPKDHEGKPHQTSLPISHPTPDNVEGDGALPIAIVTATHYALTPAAAKASLLLLAEPTIRAGGMVRATLGELTAIIHEGVGRIQAREMEATARAITMLRGLLVYLPDDTTIQMFDVQAPADAERAHAKQSLLLGLSKSAHAVLGQVENSPLGKSYRGDFLFNITGAMRLPNKKPSLLRHYIRAAAHWNAAFDPRNGSFASFKLKKYDAREWAIITNALPPAAVDYAASGARNKAPEMSKAIREVREDLDALAEEFQLLRVEKEGRDSFKLLPTEAWTEAWREMRKTGSRPSET